MCVCTHKKQNISVLSVLDIVLNFLLQSKRGVGVGVNLRMWLCACLKEKGRGIGRRRSYFSLDKYLSSQCSGYVFAFVFNI